MKSNEAPEKIYVTNFDIEALPKDEQLSERWGKVRIQDSDIEYTCTDAFIKKACVWIKENLLKHTYVYEGEVGIGMEVFLEEFKHAMKGE